MIVVSVKERGPMPRELRRGLPKISKAGFKAGVEGWHRRARPGHFTTAASSRYGYKRRSVSYMERKRRQYGHARPLVASGTALRASEQVRFAGTSKGAKARYPGLRVFNFRGAARLDKKTGRYTWSGPRRGLNMRQEFTAVDGRDRKMMTRAVDKRVDKAINSKRGIR